MYGIVNKSIEELVVSNFGQDKWEDIKSKSNINIEYFISSESYDDDVTYKLAGTIAQELNVSVYDVLRLFGEWWILHTGKNHYGYLLESGGDNFRTFILNLPSFHNRVMMMYPKLTPPEFKVSNVEDRSLHLHYFSKRKGLTAFVYGLMSGLGKFFNTNVTTQHLESVQGENTHEIIKVTWEIQ
jgi:hypothetical protein